MRRRFLIPALSLLLLLGGLLFYWPLAALGIMLAIFGRRYALSIIIGLVMDIAYGPPPAYSHFPFPFTLLALVASAAWASFSRYIRRRGRGEVL